MGFAAAPQAKEPAQEEEEKVFVAPEPTEEAILPKDGKPEISEPVPVAFNSMAVEEKLESEPAASKEEFFSVSEDKEQKVVSEPEEKKAYSATLMASDAPKLSYKAGSSFMRRFTMSNRGKFCWPEAVSLVKVGGDEDLQVLPSAIQKA